MIRYSDKRAGQAARVEEMRRPGVFHPAVLGGTAFGMVAFLGLRQAHAYKLYIGTYSDQTLTTNLETKIKYSTIYHVNDPSAIRE